MATIVGGLDLHRAQITYDVMDTRSGEVSRGRIAPANRDTFTEWLAGLGSSDAQMAVEGTTGWWYVADAMMQAGMVPLVADPAEAKALRSHKKRAKTDRTDALHLRQLVADAKVPESWIPPEHMVDTRGLARFYVDAVVCRNSWAQRIHATMFHHGVAQLAAGFAVEAGLDTARVAAEGLPAQTRWVTELAISMIEMLNPVIDQVNAQLCWIGRHQPAVRAIQRLYGMGWLTGTISWVELGDVRRFSNTDQAVRHAGLDVTIYDSDGKRTRGHLSKQGPGALRWALYEAAQASTHPRAPFHSYYRATKERKGHTPAVLSVARKLVRSMMHILIPLGDDIIAAPSPARTRSPMEVTLTSGRT